LYFVPDLVNQNIMIIIIRLPLLLLLTSTAILFGTTSCKKETEVTPAIPKFPIGYQLINEGDDNVKAFITKKYNFFPADSIGPNKDTFSFAILTWSSYNGITPYQTIYEPVDHPGYEGCTADYKIYVHFKKALWSPVWAAKGYADGGSNPVGWTNVRTYVMKTITIRSRNDRYVTFRWPSDTAICTERLGDL
jgi:hypothetical protein